MVGKASTHIWDEGGCPPYQSMWSTWRMRHKYVPSLNVCSATWRRKVPLRKSARSTWGASCTLITSSITRPISASLLLLKGPQRWDYLAIVWEVWICLLYLLDLDGKSSISQRTSEVGQGGSWRDCTEVGKKSMFCWWSLSHLKPWVGSHHWDLPFI